MPDTHNLGKFFWHRIRLRTDAPRHHRYETHEYEWPYRWARSHVLRLARNFGLVVGRWQGGDLDEESAEYEAHLHQAVQGRTYMSTDRFRRVADAIEWQVLPDGDEDRPDATRTIPKVDA